MIMIFEFLTLIQFNYIYSVRRIVKVVQERQFNTVHSEIFIFNDVVNLLLRRDELCEVIQQLHHRVGHCVRVPGTAERLGLLELVTKNAVSADGITTRVSIERAERGEVADSVSV